MLYGTREWENEQIDTYSSYAVDDDSSYELEDKPTFDNKYFEEYCKSYHLEMFKLLNENADERDVERDMDEVKDELSKEPTSYFGTKNYYQTLGMLWAWEDYLMGDID